MSDDPNLDEAAALLRELHVPDAPDWLRALAAKPEYRYAPDDWAWVWAAKQFASTRPERLLAFLAALRPIPVDRKKYALDAIGQILAIAGTAQPTLAECRTAIAEADDAPRRRAMFRKDAAPADIDAILSAFVREALGCAEELSSPTHAATGPELDRTPHTASSAVWSRIVTSRAHSATCTIEVERAESFFPGDVNEPARDSQRVTVSGTRGREARLTVVANLGSHEMWFDVEAAPEERDLILTKLWRTFGEATP